MSVSVCATLIRAFFVVAAQDAGDEPEPAPLEAASAEPAGAAEAASAPAGGKGRGHLPHSALFRAPAGQVPSKARPPAKTKQEEQLRTARQAAQTASSCLHLCPAGRSG